MADCGNAQSLKIFGGEMAQVVGADFILPECSLVALKAEASQPACDIHRRFLRLGDARGGVSPCWGGCVQEQKMVAYPIVAA